MKFSNALCQPKKKNSREGNYSIRVAKPFFDLDFRKLGFFCERQTNILGQVTTNKEYKAKFPYWKGKETHEYNN